MDSCSDDVCHSTDGSLEQGSQDGEPRNLRNTTVFPTRQSSFDFRISRLIFYLLSISIHLYNELMLEGYLSYHWQRIQVPQLLFITWCSKITAVIILGPSYFPISPTTSPMTGDEDSLMPKISAIRAYAVEFKTTPLPSENFINIDLIFTFFTTLFNRVVTALLVHGSETWISVCGIVLLVNKLSDFLVRLIIFVMDPSGEAAGRMAAHGGPWAIERLGRNGELEVEVRLEDEEDNVDSGDEAEYVDNVDQEDNIGGINERGEMRVVARRDQEQEFDELPRANIADRNRHIQAVFDDEEDIPANADLQEVNHKFRFDCLTYTYRQL
ncbi:unnamed protein product [Protopolystoma xenopodis]|uniref:Uncharacterized protein n=1 Tax=Protopolystoma xenopodis TaxID=117903 RepID=A0A3S5AB74_9PLAT|nr:unnamed protein product [Protopolystoma xenopodis]